jgi:1-acyl-sn-glycerol-3-phosphate acyltransferase
MNAARLADFHDEGHGYDLFGLEPGAVEWGRRLGAPLYDHYFRVDSRGADRVPAAGPAIVVANHAGVLPVDGSVLWLDLVRRTDRLPRMIADRFVPRLPIVGTLFARSGVVSGTRTNVRRLLERGELVVIFPEGVSGVAKPWSERYLLQRWSVGHAELAIRHRAPVIPVAIVGAEESWPVLARLRGIRAFGAPYLPIPMVPLPLPVRYHLRYGAPIRFDEIPAHRADDPELVAGCAGRVQVALERLIEASLAERHGVFR